jgi:hypothetical protein
MVCEYHLDRYGLTRGGELRHRLPHPGHILHGTVVAIRAGHIIQHTELD